MIDSPPDASRNPDSDNEGMPRWVKVSAVIAIVFVLVFVIVHLAGGGFDHHHGGHSDADHP